LQSLFVDTSTLVKYYYPEQGSEEVEEILLRAERIYLCQITPAEFASALMKKVRTGSLEMEEQTLIWNVFLEDLATRPIEIISLGERHYKKAIDLIMEYGRKLGIRTLDSLQIAAAFDVQDSIFFSDDKVLSGVAAEMGFKLTGANPPKSRTTASTTEKSGGKENG
jgi:predicted nucleic acid-binding protein